jgi:hypothetical protein
MKSSDKFLVSIVVAIILLVVVVFAVVLTRPEPAYQPEETASGVAHNYLLALQREEFERAYGYLSPRLSDHPASVEEFSDQLEDYAWRFREDVEKTMAVESERVVGSRTVVSVRETRFYGGGLFDSGQSVNTFEMKLEQEGDAWKLVDADDYFAHCWIEADGCN